MSTLWAAKYQLALHFIIDYAHYQIKKSVIIEGLAASIASIISMVGDEIHMALGSEMMIHNPSAYVFGEADDFEKLPNRYAKLKKTLSIFTRLAQG